MSEEERGKSRDREEKVQNERRDEKKSYRMSEQEGEEREEIKRRSPISEVWDNLSNKRKMKASISRVLEVRVEGENLSRYEIKTRKKSYNYDEIRQ